MSINGGDSDSDASPEGSGPNKETKKKKLKNNKDCNGDGVDTSNFTIEERLVAAVWVHERKFEKMSMSQVHKIIKYYCILQKFLIRIFFYFRLKLIFGLDSINPHQQKIRFIFGRKKFLLLVKLWMLKDQVDLVQGMYSNG